MSSLPRILFFVLFVTTVLGGAHFYLWRRLVRDASLGPRLERTLTVLFLLLVVCVPTTFFLSRSVPRETLAPLAFVTFTWMGLLSTYVVLTVVADGGRLLSRLLPSRWNSVANGSDANGSDANDADASDADLERHAAGTGLSRRQAMGRLMAGGVVAGGTVISGAAVAHALGFRLEEVEIALDKLAPEFDGFTIVQMSDIHVGPTIGRDFIERIVAVANEQQADLIALTGDLVDGSVKNLARHTAPLAKLSAREGAVFVTGNHEYYSGADDWIEELDRLGIPTLRNDARRVERNGASLLIAGVTDHRAASFGDAPDFGRALRKRRPDEEVVLLAHQPRAVSEAAKHDVGLQLSGHTHGGQFWPWSWVIYLIEPVVKGWARFGRTQIYVNSGTGYWGPPMRSGTTAEITKVTLRSKQRAGGSAS